MTPIIGMPLVIKDNDNSTWVGTNSILDDLLGGLNINIADDEVTVVLTNMGDDLYHLNAAGKGAFVNRYPTIGCGHPLENVGMRCLVAMTSMFDVYRVPDGYRLVITVMAGSVITVRVPPIAQPVDIKESTGE